MLLPVQYPYALRMVSKQEQQLMKAFGRRVADIRKSKGVTQQQLSEATGLNVVSIAYIENGKRWARLGTLSKMAKSLEVRISTFFDGI